MTRSRPQPRRVPFELEPGRTFTVEFWPARILVVDPGGTPTLSRWAPYQGQHLAQLRFAHYGRTLLVAHPELRLRALWCRNERDWPFVLVKL